MYLFGKEEIFVAGKEFKGKDKKVAKMTRDGLTEENLRDGSVKDISHRSRRRPENKEEFVPERIQVRMRISMLLKTNMLRWKMP